MTDSSQTASQPLGLIEATGEQAAEFLRAQLTNDVFRLGSDTHMLAAWCDAKGRAVLLGRLLESRRGYLLILPKALIETALSRLRMFVLRAQVELSDASARYRIDGVIEQQAPEPGCIERRDDRIVLGITSAQGRAKRALVLANPTTPRGPGAVSPGSDAWELEQVDAGIPTVLPATQALFVPQMLNLHWLGGIDFDKGCYPGQEVIARLHYRGRLTQRVYRLAWRGPRPAAGDDVIDANGARCGTVVRSAVASPDAGRALAVVKTDAVNQRLATGGAGLELLDLPYATPI